MSFSGGAGWFKLATAVPMPQAQFRGLHNLIVGGAGYNVITPQQAGISELVLRAGNGIQKVLLVHYMTDLGWIY